ncbi:MAG: (d)CMP kinase [Candidatus Dormibacteria bacterium]
MSAPPVVTVDGPAGSGKTTLGRRLAAALQLPFIDTGLFYRAVTVAVVAAGLDAADPERIAQLARRTTIEINTTPADASWELRINGDDPGESIRDPRHALLLSTVSQIPGVRSHLLGLQRAPAGGGAVAVGRDCGTVVFPGARVKLYLQASETLRAARRSAELERRGSAVDHGTIDSEIAGRDRTDAPSLSPAAGAIVIDTGTRGIDEMVAIALRHCAAAGVVGKAADGTGRAAGDTAEALR